MQFQVIATANQWDRTVQLAAALDGEARRVLLDLLELDMTDPLAIACAIEGQFGDPTSKSTARHLLNE